MTLRVCFAVRPPFAGRLRAPWIARLEWPRHGSCGTRRTIRPGYGCFGGTQRGIGGDGSGDRSSWRLISSRRIFFRECPGLESRFRAGKTAFDLSSDFGFSSRFVRVAACRDRPSTKPSSGSDDSASGSRGRIVDTQGSRAWPTSHPVRVCDPLICSISGSPLHRVHHARVAVDRTSTQRWQTGHTSRTQTALIPTDTRTGAPPSRRTPRTPWSLAALASDWVAPRCCFVHCFPSETLLSTSL
jgi:hypothetical protein